MDFHSETTYQPIDNDAKVVDKVFTVEKVVGSQQEVPRQTTEPRQTMDAIHLVSNWYYFFEAFHLNKQRLLIKLN